MNIKDVVLLGKTWVVRNGTKWRSRYYQLVLNVCGFYVTFGATGSVSMGRNVWGDVSLANRLDSGLNFTLYFFGLLEVRRGNVNCV